MTVYPESRKKSIPERKTMKKDTDKKWVVKALHIFTAVALVALLVIGYIVKSRKDKVPDLSFQEALEYTTKGDADAVITVGIIKDGVSSYKVYGEDGKELPAQSHTYEIGSLTKTFTAALVRKAMLEGKIDIYDTIDEYLDFPSGRKYPTVQQILTHTAGYREYYFELPMIFNKLTGRNDYYGISEDRVQKRAGRIRQKYSTYGFKYSNFGYAVLGLILESVYGKDYTELVNGFVKDELSLTDTHISTGDGDLGRYWKWKDDDAYISAGAVTSTIDDMLAYAQLQLEDEDIFLYCHYPQKEIGATTKQYAAMGIRMDEIGMSWIIDDENGIIWHNGGTGHYNSYLGFIPEKGIAVVVLSNLAPGRRIPATVLGAKLLTELAGD